jgi:hypothetical protein
MQMLSRAFVHYVTGLDADDSDLILATLPPKIHHGASNHLLVAIVGDFS